MIFIEILWKFESCFDSLFFVSRIELFWFLLDSRRKDFRKDCFCCRTEAFNIYIISRWYNNQRGKGNILAKRIDECKYVLTRYSQFLSYEISQIFAVTLVTIISSQYLSAIRFFLHNIRLLLYTQYYNDDQDEFKKRRRRKKVNHPKNKFPIHSYHDGCDNVGFILLDFRVRSKSNVLCRDCLESSLVRPFSHLER